MLSSQTHLLILAPLLLFLLAGALCFPAGRKRWNAVFEMLVLLSVVAGRWPAIFAGRLNNPDESQIIAGAATLWRHPEFWKWVDGMTVGPLSYYAVWLGKLAGLGFTYEGARMVAAVFYAVSTVALYRFLRNQFSELPAKVAVVPFVAFGSLNLFWDMVQFGNETTPVFLLCIGMWLAFPAVDYRGNHYVRMAAAGIALGAVPFGKLQVAPMAVFVGVTALVAVFLRDNKSGMWGRASALVAGAITVPAIAAVYLTIYNLWTHFLTTYLQNNITYVQHGQNLPVELLKRFIPYLIPSEGTLHLFIGTLALLLTCIWQVPSFSRRARNWTMWGTAWLAVSIASIVLPGRAFEHYQTLLLPALLILGGACICGQFSIASPPAGRFAFITIFLLLTTLPLAWARLSTHQASLDHLKRGPDEFNPVTEEILKFAQPGEKMAIWGWQPNLWVSTSLIQGTRDGISVKQVYPSPEQDYYLHRYMFDLKRNLPPVFLDTAGPGRFAFDPRSKYGHESWPELAAFVSANYVLHSDLVGIRIYLRKDRAPPVRAPKEGG
jgi:hypothetical protein